MRRLLPLLVPALPAALLLFQLACASGPSGPAASASDPASEAGTVDLVLRGGMIYDGSGGPPYRGDVAVRGDRITAVGNVGALRGREEIELGGLAVAPGFINMLSWATESLIEDGRALSDIRQGVTLEVFGEGFSMGPLDEKQRSALEARQGEIRFEVEWTTLGEYLEYLEARGVSPNVASFVGATTLRMHTVGQEHRKATPRELDEMRRLTREAMREGALGVGSSLIYAPAFYADTDELTALAEVAAEHGGMYISHLRSEGDRFLEALDELIEIARRSGARAEVYHLKAAGRDNWPKLDEAVARIEAARAEGLAITADMYTYPAGATGLDASMPPWVKEGGREAFTARLGDPEIRARVIREMREPSGEWENLLLAAGSADRVLLAGFRSEALKPLTGKTLAEVAEERGVSPEEAAVDLVREDDSRVEAVYFLMSEENVAKKVALPWMSFGSDAEAPAPEGVFLETSAHPRTYGTFARLLGKYVRDEGVIPLEEAVRRLTSLPAQNLALRDRGSLAPGAFADLVVFDPARVQDHSTFEDPHQLSTGVLHVWVNGVRVLADQEHTGATPGRVVRGPGWTGWKKAARR